MKRQNDSAIYLLAGMVLVLLLALFLAEWWFKDDAQFYQSIAGLLSGFGGALLLRITGPSRETPPMPPAPAGSVPESPTPPAPGS